MRKALARLVAGFIIVLAMLFLPAWTVAYWEAWAYVAILFVPVTLVVAYLLANDPELLERRMRTRETDGGQALIVKLGSICYTILGFQSMAPFATYTHALDHVGVIGTYIDLGRRRQGIAKCLFPATFEAARQKGYEKIFTYILADNPAALAAYQKHGFRIIGKADRHAKLHGRYVDVI